MKFSEAVLWKKKKYTQKSVGESKEVTFAWKLFKRSYGKDKHNNTSMNGISWNPGRKLLLPKI